MASDYSKKTNAELVEILKSRGLPHTGKKADMVARLQEDDNKKAAPPAKTDLADDVIDWEDDEVPAQTAAPAQPAKPQTEAAAPAEEKNTAPTAGEPNKAEGEATGVAAEPQGDGGAEQGPSTEAPAETATATKPETEEKPAPSFSLGLSVTDMEEELRKRKARAEKFGITEDTKAAIEEAEKKLERAKRFGSAPETTSSATVSRLDQALPEKSSRKRGRGEDDQGSRGGKRRNFNGRNNARQQRRGRGNRNQGQGAKRSTNNSESSTWSEKDKQAMEARKKRFGTGA